VCTILNYNLKCINSYPARDQNSIALSKGTADCLQIFGNVLQKHLTNLNKIQLSEPTAEPGIPLSADSNSCITSSIVNEQHERERWQLNLIVHNVPNQIRMILFCKEE